MITVQLEQDKSEREREWERDYLLFEQNFRLIQPGIHLHTIIYVYEKQASVYNRN